MLTIEELKRVCAELDKMRSFYMLHRFTSGGFYIEVDQIKGLLVRYTDTLPVEPPAGTVTEEEGMGK